MDIPFAGPSLQSSDYVLLLFLRVFSGAYNLPHPPRTSRMGKKPTVPAYLPHFWTKEIVALGA